MAVSSVAVNVFSRLNCYFRARELARILDRVVEIGLRGGWAELQDTPLQIPRIQLNIGRPESELSPPSPTDTTKLDSQ